MDYEDGASGNIAANTDAILYGMRRIAQAGYTPMYYSYKPYTLAHVDYNRILAEFPNSLWIAAYPDYQVRTDPDYGWFPSMPGIGIWQFTSMHAVGGLDGNVDLLGITYNGYGQNPPQPKPQPAPAPVSSYHSDYEQHGVFQPNVAVNIRTGAGTAYAILGSYAPGAAVYYDHVYIRRGLVWARYLAYSAYDHYVCLGVMGGQDYGSRTTYAQTYAHVYYTVRLGDSFWAIAQRYGISMYTLAANNGKSIYSVIYPGESLLIR